MARDRERIDTGRDVRYIRRDERGRFTSDQVDVGGSNAADRRQRAQHVVHLGQGDRGDRRESDRLESDRRRD
jgi:hypothetical protein